MFACPSRSSARDDDFASLRVRSPVRSRLDCDIKTVAVRPWNPPSYRGANHDCAGAETVRDVAVVYGRRSPAGLRLRRSPRLITASARKWLWTAFRGNPSRLLVPRILLRRFAHEPRSVFVDGWVPVDDGIHEPDGPDPSSDCLDRPVLTVRSTMDDVPSPCEVERAPRESVRSGSLRLHSFVLGDSRPSIRDRRIAPSVVGCNRPPWGF